MAEFKVVYLMFYIKKDIGDKYVIVINIKYL